MAQVLQVSPDMLCKRHACGLEVKLLNLIEIWNVEDLYCGEVWNFCGGNLGTAGRSGSNTLEF